MNTIKNILRLTALALAMIFICVDVGAQDIKATPGVTPFPFYSVAVDAQIDNKIEPSAIEPIGNDGKYFLVADDKDDDKGHSLKVVDSHGVVIKTLENFQGNEKNPKWEAMAKDDNRYFYVIGQHNDKDPVKRATRSRIFRFRLKSEAETNPANFAIDMSTVELREMDIKKSLSDLKLYNVKGAVSAAKIEGLAIQTIGCTKRLVVGLREPFFNKSDVQVYYADIPDEKQWSSGVVQLTLNPYFHFKAGKPDNSKAPFQLSSIEYVEKLKGFLIMTSTEDGDNNFYGNALWFAGDEMIAEARKVNPFAELKLDFLKPAAVFEPTMKAEGLSVLPPLNGEKLRLVIVFDNDAGQTGKVGKMGFWTLADNTAKLVAWTSASHVERPAKKKKPTTPTP